MVEFLKELKVTVELETNKRTVGQELDNLADALALLRAMKKAVNAQEMAEIVETTDG